MITRHIKPSPGIRQGGRVQQEASIHISNVKLIQSNYTEPSTQFRQRDSQANRGGTAKRHDYYPARTGPGTPPAPPG